eukprot:SAG25_NODE_714_length_5789_cov_9.025294_6_plen_69_part_00
MVAIAVIPPPHLSLPFPCISCLAVCVCGYPGYPGAARAYSRSARYACLLCAQVWLRAGGATYDAGGCL